MSTKTAAFLVIAICLFGSILPAIAAPTELRIGYVDLQKALSTSKAGGEAQKEYEKEVKQMQAKLDQKKLEFEKEQGEFQKQKESLSGDAKTSREEKLINLEKSLKRTFEDSQETLRRKNGMLVSDLLKKMRKIVDKVGKDEGYTMILEKSSQSVLYADSSIDITDRVVKEFDAAN